jgi:hypothetical protein
MWPATRPSRSSTPPPGAERDGRAGQHVFRATTSPSRPRAGRPPHRKTGELLLQVSLVVQSATGKLNGPYLLGRPKGCPHPHVTSVKPGRKKAKTKKPAAKQGRRA